MTERTERKLAAIMFLDMVGYTKLMQENEAEAVAKRDRHREVLRREVAEHGGEILQYWGDGTLCLFSSAVEAVHCAVDIQRAMQKPPEIPLRIGIHLGDVAQDEEGLYGDGVNIAARIESLSAPGAVLISGKMQDEIKNQEELPTVSLGRFRLKNVAKPVEIFAVQAEGLQVPSSEEMEGKGVALDRELLETTGNTAEGKARLNWKWVAGAFAMLIAALFLWNLNQGGKQEQSDSLAGADGVVTMAFLPMQNQTGSPQLQLLGPYLAGPLQASFQQIENVEVILPEIVMRHLSSIGILPGNPEGKPSFSELTGAEVLLRGSYFLNGEDSIQLNMALWNPRTGKNLHAFESISEPIDNKKELAVRMTAQLLGYWATHHTSESEIELVKAGTPENIPDFEVAKLFFQAHQIQIDHNDKALALLEKAHKMDSTYFPPMVLMAHLYYSEQKFEKLEKLIAKIERQAKSEIQKIDLEILRALYNGNARKLLDLRMKQHQLVPQSEAFAGLLLLPAIALDQAEEILQLVGHKANVEAPEWAVGPLAHAYYAWFAYAFNLAGQYEKALEVDYVPSEVGSTFLHAMKIRKLAHIQDASAIDEYIQRVGNRRLNVSEAPAFLYLQAAWDYELLDKEAETQQFAKRALETYQELPTEKREAFIPYCHLLSGDIDQAIEGFGVLARKYPEELRYLAMQGVAYSRMPEMNEAQQILQQIEQWPDNERGWKQYWTAALLSNLGGDRDRIDALLQESRQKGMSIFYDGMHYFFWNTYQDDIALEPYFDGPEFQ